MFELYNSDPIAMGDRPKTPAQRHAILERQVKRMVATGYQMLTEFDDRAILVREQSISVIEIFVDEYGELWYP